MPYPQLEQRTAVLFMSFSGARSGEVINVLVKHYNPNTARVLIADTKNGDPREVLLPPFVNDAMRLLPMGNPEARLFGYASRFSLVRIIKRGCNRAKINTSHRTRSAATRLPPASSPTGIHSRRCKRPEDGER